MMDPIFNTATMAAAEAAVNQCLQRDPASLLALAKLEGKVLAFECKHPSVTITMEPHDQGIRLSAQNEIEADAKLKLSISDAMALLAAKDKNAEVFRRQLEITGSTSLLSEFFNIMSSFEIDWEAELSQWIGGIAAHQIGQGLKSLLEFGQATVKNFQNNMSDYLQEESQYSINKEALAALNDDLYDLKLDIDRLQARVDQLSQQPSPSSD